MGAKAKVLFVGDLVVPTGFSTVLHNIIGNVVEDFDVIGVGVNYKGDPHNYNFPIFPAMLSNQGNIYGIDRVLSIIQTHAVDVVFILNDAWVVSYYLSAIKQYIQNPPKVIVYFPVDSEYHNPEWYRDFDIVTKAVTYTEFGREVVKKCNPEIEVDVIPHGVESSHFFDMQERTGITKTQLRETLFGAASNQIENPGDLFIVLNANRNQPRKRLDVTMEGFSIFAENKPDARLYMHSGLRDASVDIPYLAVRYGITDKLMVTNKATGVQRVSIDRLNMIYNCADVGINTSMGEGWGLCNTEHAVTGALQIVPRHSSCAELFSDCGLLMETSLKFTFDNSQTVGKLVSPEEVARVLELAYTNKELRNSLANKAKAKFTSKEYSWKTVATQFKNKILEVL